MSDTKHTPTPWIAGIYGRITGDHRHLGMHGAVCTEVANCKPDQPGLTWENRDTWAPKAEANAAHIVKCVNAHDALVAALIRCIEIAKDPDSFKYDVQAVASNALSELGLHPTQTKVAALKLARGES